MPAAGAASPTTRQVGKTHCPRSTFDARPSRPRRFGGPRQSTGARALSGHILIRSSMINYHTEAAS
jgi:hypothetical protein